MTWSKIVPNTATVTAWHNVDGTVTLVVNHNGVQLDEENRRSLAEYLLEGLE